MAAPMARFLQRGVCTTVASSLRYHGTTQAKQQLFLQHKMYSVCMPQNKSAVDSLAKRLSNQCYIGTPASHPFSSLTSLAGSPCHSITTNICSISRSPVLLQPVVKFPVQPRRTIIRYSKGKGKKKSSNAVLDRFYRFNSGLWLRCRAGRNKKIWKKSAKRRKRIKQFVFCSGSQSKKLDLMVTSYWRRQKNIPDDPFAPFEDRNWYGYKDHPGNYYVRKMYEKGAPINAPFRKKQL